MLKGYVDILDILNTSENFRNLEILHIKDI